MEIEYKYLLDNREQAYAIFIDPTVTRVKDEDSFETIDMHSVYYDTDDYALTKAGIAVRVRKEGEDYVATMKDKGKSIEGLHKREEINVRLSDVNMINAPDVTIFEQSDAYDRLLEVAGKGKLTPVIEMKFERRQVRIDTGESISVLSADDGEIIAGTDSIPLMELEIELYSGRETDMREFAVRLAEKYGLRPEDKSKFERGYECLHNKCSRV